MVSEHCIKLGNSGQFFKIKTHIEQKSQSEIHTSMLKGLWQELDKYINAKWE